MLPFMKSSVHNRRDFIKTILTGGIALPMVGLAASGGAPASQPGARL
jgi:hypothetical protein